MNRQREIIVTVTYNELGIILDTKAEPRKTGQWIRIDDGLCDVYECDQCGTTYDTVDGTWDLPKYCPNCGSPMMKEGEG